MYYSGNNFKVHENLTIGDRNCRVGKSEEMIGIYGKEIRNKNGDKLFQLCAKYGYGIENRFFKHKNVHKYTWQETALNRVDNIS